MAANRVTVGDLTISYTDQGEGPVLVLLHGWPEWSAVWRHNIGALSAQYRVIAPDLRNFGDSTGKPAESVETYAQDLAGFADALGLDRFGIVSHDLGAFVAQEYARLHPDRLIGLFFFNCPHFGIGKRWVEKGQVREIWYQSFHLLPMSEELVGLSRETCRIYFRHFLQHWAHHDDAFETVLDEWVDTFSKPGRLAGGFRWYQVATERRLRALDGGAEAAPPKITVPAYSLWGESDPVLRAEWRETLNDVFEDVALEVAQDAGHFVHWERPDLANTRILDFFNSLTGRPL